MSETRRYLPFSCWLISDNIMNCVYYVSYNIMNWRVHSSCHMWQDFISFWLNTIPMPFFFTVCHLRDTRGASLAVVNDVAANRGIHMPLQYTYFLSFGCMLSSKSAGSYVCLFVFFHFKETSRLFSEIAVLICVSTKYI